MHYWRQLWEYSMVCTASVTKRLLTSAFWCYTPAEFDIKYSRNCQLMLSNLKIKAKQGLCPDAAYEFQYLHYTTNAYSLFTNTNLTFILAIMSLHFTILPFFLAILRNKLRNWEIDINSKYYFFSQNCKKNISIVRYKHRIARKIVRKLQLPFIIIILSRGGKTITLYGQNH